VRRVLVAAALAALAACAELQPRADSAAAVDGIVGEAVAAARAPAAEQKAALQRAQEAYAARPEPLHRLRLAVLLATLPAPLRDEARAGQLLEPLADAGARGPGRFAALLGAQIAERQRLARELERARGEVERAKGEVERAAREREKAERERERIDRERDKREETLKQQLEALRSIERGILEREEKLRRRQR
jgi:hypothetical protein